MSALLLLLVCAWAVGNMVALLVNHVRQHSKLHADPKGVSEWDIDQLNIHTGVYLAVWGGILFLAVQFGWIGIAVALAVEIFARLFSPSK